MKQIGQSVPETDFTIPSSAPKPVQEAYDKFRQVADAYLEAQGNLADLKELKPIQVHEARVASIAARTTGSVPPKRTATMVEAEFDKKIAATLDDIESLRQATHVVGNQLATAINTAQESWLTTVDEAEADATAKLRSALSMARQAIGELAEARSAPEWLRNFNLRDAHEGAQPMFTAQELRVDAIKAGVGTFDSFTPAASIVKLLDLVADPPEEYVRTRKRPRNEAQFAGAR